MLEYMHPVTRLFVATLLVGFVVASGVHYATESSTHWPYPDTTQLKTAPEDHTDTKVFLFGTVEQIDSKSDTAKVRVESDAGPFTLEIRGFDTQRDVQPGGIVQVVGKYGPGYVVEAENVRVVNPAGSSNLYKYAVSAVAAVLILVLFFRHWRVTVRNLSFEVR